MDLASLAQLAWPVLLKGTGYTLLFALAAMVLGLALGALIALLRVLEVPLLAQLARLYVSAFRGTPLLVQVFIVYYGLPSIGIEFSPITAGILALTLNVAAYLSESLRGAVLGVSQGQWMAGRSLGLTHVQTLRHVVAPQALRHAVPSLSNSLISLIKDTSLVSVIAVTELMLATKELISTTFQPFPLYLAAAAVYWVLSLGFEQVQKGLERRLAFPH
jgi:cystine transport system permease protein